MNDLQRFEMSDRTYEGANPQYVNVGKEVFDPTAKMMVTVPHYIKVAKGVPFRKVEVDDRQAKIEARRARRLMAKARIAYNR